VLVLGVLFLMGCTGRASITGLVVSDGGMPNTGSDTSKDIETNIPMQDVIPKSPTSMNPNHTDTSSESNITIYLEPIPIMITKKT